MESISPVMDSACEKISPPEKENSDIDTEHCPSTVEKERELKSDVGTTHSSVLEKDHITRAGSNRSILR